MVLVVRKWIVLGGRGLALSTLVVAIEPVTVTIAVIVSNRLVLEAHTTTIATSCVAPVHGTVVVLVIETSIVVLV